MIFTFQMEQSREVFNWQTSLRLGKIKTQSLSVAQLVEDKAFKTTHLFYSFCVCIRCWILIWLYKCDAECDKGLHLLMTACAFISCLVSHRSSGFKCQLLWQIQHFYLILWIFSKFSISDSNEDLPNNGADTVLAEFGGKTPFRFSSRRIWAITWSAYIDYYP